MSVEVLEIHHCAVRVGVDPGDLAEAQLFYSNILGMDYDRGRPNIPTVPGFWMNIGDVGQVHLISVDGRSDLSPAPGKDPTSPHIAFAVANIADAKRELDRLAVPYWTLGVLGGPDTEQVFLEDLSGNMIELHQIGSCRCAVRSRLNAGAQELSK
jgi:catechol 2,3-dioxygenase-like lactoylglutathione lyase family enzyme